MTAKDLKNALLQEAVQGKLVPQIASEGNARNLLEEIRKERLSHGLDFANAKSGKKSKKKTALAGSNPCDIPEDEIPFDIPESWCWCRLGEISYKITDGEHKTPNRVNNFCGYYLLSARNILNGSISLDKVDYVDAAEYEKISKRCNPVKGDVLISCSGSVGRSAVVNDNNHYVMVRSAAMTRPIINDSFFIMYCIQSPCLQEQIQESIKQAVQANLFQEAIRNLLIPLPPLAEQKRIVAAIEKFMPLIEEYGKKETVLNELNAQIGTITKKAILQEAVQGKLVPQIASEGNAKDLLEQIRKERLSHGLDFANAKSKKKSKKETALADSNPCDILENEIPFDIPENWCWCRFEELMYLLSSKNCQIKQSDILTEGKYPVISQSQKKIEGYYNDSSKMLKNPGIVLVFGDHSRTIKFIDFDFIVGADGTQLIVPIRIDSKYFYYFIKYVIINLPERNYGRHFSLLKSHPVPLPPLSEQKRIVAAIEQLLPLCEKLGK